jgi:uncharacterized cupredoxin-like copper-binding protein
MYLKSTVIAVLLGLGFTCAASADETHHGHHQPVVEANQQPWGIAGSAEQVARTIEITMSDQMRFSPERIEVKEGETIRFVLPNNGEVQHEFVLGEKGQLDKYADMVLKGMGMQHADTGMSHVAPGQNGELVWTFNRVGEFDFACLIAGHYQAGMVGKVKVSPR